MGYLIVGAVVVVLAAIVVIVERTVRFLFVSAIRKDEKETEHDFSGLD